MGEGWIRGLMGFLLGVVSDGRPRPPTSDVALASLEFSDAANTATLDPPATLDQSVGRSQVANSDSTSPFFASPQRQENATIEVEEGARAGSRELEDGASPPGSREIEDGASPGSHEIEDGPGPGSHEVEPGVSPGFREVMDQPTSGVSSASKDQSGTRAVDTLDVEGPTRRGRLGASLPQSQPVQPGRELVEQRTTLPTVAQTVPPEPQRGHEPGHDESVANAASATAASLPRSLPVEPTRVVDEQRAALPPVTQTLQPASSSPVLPPLQASRATVEQRTADSAPDDPATSRPATQAPIDRRTNPLPAPRERIAAIEHSSNTIDTPSLTDNAPAAGTLGFAEVLGVAGTAAVARPPVVTNPKPVAVSGAGAPLSADATSLAHQVDRGLTVEEEAAGRALSTAQLHQGREVSATANPTPPPLASNQEATNVSSRVPARGGVGSATERHQPGPAERMPDKTRTDQTPPNRRERSVAERDAAPQRRRPRDDARPSVTEPRVHIGHVEIVVMPPATPSRGPAPAPTRPTGLASRLYLRSL